MRNSRPMAGSEIFTEDILKGPRKEVNVVIIKTNLLVRALSILVVSIIVTLDKRLLNFVK